MKRRGSEMFIYFVVKLPVMQADVKIDSALLQKLKQRSETSGYTSVEDYIADILAKVVANLEKKEGDSAKAKAHSSEEEEKIKANLRKLGYM